MPMDKAGIDDCAAAADFDGPNVAGDDPQNSSQALSSTLTRRRKASIKDELRAQTAARTQKHKSLPNFKLCSDGTMERTLSLQPSRKRAHKTFAAISVCCREVVVWAAGHASAFEVEDCE